MTPDRYPDTPFRARIGTTTPHPTVFQKRPVRDRTHHDFVRSEPLDLTALLAPGVDPSADAFDPSAPLVYDFAGLEWTGPVPLRFYHGRPVIGEVRAVWSLGDRLFARGVVYGLSLAGMEVIAAAVAGEAHWGTSIGVRALDTEFRKVPAGGFATVNGVVIPGPLLVAARWRLDELSVGAVGDCVDDTSFIVEANAPAAVAAA